MYQACVFVFITTKSYVDIASISWRTGIKVFQVPVLIFMCVCVCVCERERERERERVWCEPLALAVSIFCPNRNLGALPVASLKSENTCEAT